MIFFLKYLDESHITTSHEMRRNLTHSMYFDNGFYTKIVAKGNENLFYNHYKSLISYVPLLDIGKINIYFTWGSLLEAIGLGKLRRKLKPRLDLTAFYIQKEDTNVFHKLDQLFEYTYQYFLNHKELGIDLILCKIEEQLILSSNQATTHIVEDTLGRYKKSIIESPNDCQETLAHYLTWDTVCECPFANFDQIRDEKGIKKIRAINEWLLRTFHDKRAEGVDLSLYRLADKVGKEFFSEDLEEKVKYKKIFPYLLENRKDLCDVEVIDFATLPKEPSIVITADKPEVIRQRLIVQSKTVRFLCNLQGSKLQLSPGLILFVDQKSCVVYDKLDVNELDAKEGIVLSIEPISSKRDQVSFNTNSYRKESEEFNLQ